jgi:hypothetical protein
MNTQDLTIYSTEVCDRTTEGDDGRVRLSELSVLVSLCFDERNYTLQYQTTLTQSYNCSSKLASSVEDSDHEALCLLIDDDDEFNRLLEAVAEESAVQDIWNDYVEKNFNVNRKNFDFMDLESEIKEVTRKA